MIALALLLSFFLAPSPVFERVFQAAATPRASSPVRQNGQSLHVLTVLFPSATADVSGFSIRLEATADGVLWVPISTELTSAKYSSDRGFAYAMISANGTYKGVRARLVEAAALPVTVHYSGGLAPIGEYQLSGDRYVSTQTLPVAPQPSIPSNGGTASNRKYGVRLTYSDGKWTLPADFGSALVVFVNGLRYAQGIDFSIVSGKVNPLSDNWPDFEAISDSAERALQIEQTIVTADYEPVS